MVNIRGLKPNNSTVFCCCVCPLCLHLLSRSFSGCYNVILESGKYAKDQSELFPVLDDAASKVVSASSFSKMLCCHMIKAEGERRTGNLHTADQSHPGR